MKGNNGGVFWGIVVVSVVLHFSYCEWSRYYESQSAGSIIGVRDLGGIRAKSGRTSGDAIIFGIAAPLALVAAGTSLKP